MSKRLIFPQQQGDRKKVKLDVTISDHNFPLSQNAGSIKEPNQTSWGDDNDDEILLLASQACEDVYNDLSLLPDYSLCMQPPSTSTQMHDPGPSTSKTFNFKKPSSLPPNVVSTNLKDKCNRISSPLPDMCSKVMPKVNGNINLSDDLIFNDKIYEGPDSDYVYRQLLQLQEENKKLKSENGKLLEKCVTKEGEASILRTQLKTSQTVVDNARLDRIKAQEKVQMEWTEKLSAANGQMHDLRTQLDFKNLEIISIKERCRMLESNKIKLTQVTVANNDISSSHRNSINAPIESLLAKRVKVSTSSVQTEDKAHFLKLNKTCRSEPSKLADILPLILEPTPDQPSLMEQNEKLQRHTDHNRCRVYSTFHRVPSPPAQGKESRAPRVTLGAMYEALTCVAAAGSGDAREKYYSIFSAVMSVLSDVSRQLQLVSQHMTTAFLREMDERYIESTAALLVVDYGDLLSGRSLYKDEQAILARRMTAILNCILQSANSMGIFKQFENRTSDERLIDFVCKICDLLDNTSCSLLHSGLLLSLTNLTTTLSSHLEGKAMAVVKSIIASRPMPFVSVQLLAAVRRMSLLEGFMGVFCPGSGAGNLKVDYDQGVLLYRKDSCCLQILLKQIEGALKSAEQQALGPQAAATAQHLLALFTNVNTGNTSVNVDQDKSRCDCQRILLQVIVYALRICAVMVKSSTVISTGQHTSLLGACRAGIRLLHRCALRDAELCSRLAHAEGHLMQFCDLMRSVAHSDPYEHMLTELSSTFQSSPEDMTSSFHRQAWMKSFQSFSIAD